jgi:hypothetical protein
MKKQKLHEIAKFCAGLAFADILFLLWMKSHAMFPASILGITWDSENFLPGLIFNIALLLIFIHYGWNIGKIPVIRERTYLQIIGIIFGVVAIIHLYRLFFGGLEVQIFSWAVPMAVSWIGVIITAYFSYLSITLARRLK